MEKSKIGYRLTPDAEENRKIFEGVRVNEGLDIKNISTVTGRDYSSVLRVFHKAQPIASSLVTCVDVARGMGYEILLVPASATYTGTDIEVVEIKTRHPTRTDVLRMLGEYYPRLNQLKLADALGISQPAINKALRKKRK